MTSTSTFCEKTKITEKTSINNKTCWFNFKKGFLRKTEFNTFYAEDIH